MENKLSGYLYEFLKTKTGLPFVEMSAERILDNKYHKNTSSKHNHYEVVYVQKGKATFDIEGENKVLLKKDFMIIKPNISHKLIIDSEEPCSFITLYFDFKKTDKSVVDLEEFLYSKENFGALVSLNSIYKNEIVNALNKITREMGSELPDSELLCSLSVMEIFVWISRAIKDDWETSVNRNKDKLKEIMEKSKEFIEENYNNEEVGLSDIANNVYLSPSHFARVFKNYYNISPIQYMLSVRIEKAKELLKNSSMKITDISYEVGFQAQQRFNDIFKKQEGISPSEFRKNFKNKKGFLE